MLYKQATFQERYNYLKSIFGFKLESSDNVGSFKTMSGPSFSGLSKQRRAFFLVDSGRQLLWPCSQGHLLSCVHWTPAHVPADMRQMPTQVAYHLETNEVSSGLWTGFKSCWCKIKIDLNRKFSLKMTKLELKRGSESGFKSGRCTSQIVPIRLGTSNLNPTPCSQAYLPMVDRTLEAPNSIWTNLWNAVLWA